MKKIPGNPHNKSAFAPLRATGFNEEDPVSARKDFFLSGKGPAGIVNPTSRATPLYATPLDRRFNRVLKRLFDIFFAVTVTVLVLSWLVPIIAILIKLDSKGPVFFLQKRNKKNGGIFMCLKFRSMAVNDECDLVQVAENDTRITRVGKFLRRNWLDELPQLLNVLLGDMSVIGPRPHMLSDNLKYGELIRQYFYRNKIKPGITGLAQITGYVGATFNLRQMQERVNADIFYIRHWSLKLDCTILYCTLRKILG